MNHLVFELAQQIPFSNLQQNVNNNKLNMSTFQTECSRIPIKQGNIKEDLYSNTNYPSKRTLKYILAVISVIILTLLIVSIIKPEPKTNGNQQPVQFADDINNDNDKLNYEANINVDLTAGETIQDALNDELNKYFNPTKAKLDTDLVSIEFQYYFHPEQTSRIAIIDSVKQSMPFSCGDDYDDKIIIVEARNTYIGGGVKSLRQRKNLAATKDKKIGLYDRTVKAVVSDINNFEERGDEGIPYTKSKHKESNVIEEDKIKYEINRVIKSIDDGIEIQNILGYSSTVEFNSDQQFVNITDQKDINRYFDNVYSVLPADYVTATTYLTWTEFECDVGRNIGEIEFDVQICYKTKEGALSGDGELDPNCANKINYKIDKDSGYWYDWQQLQDELSRILPFIV